MGYIEKCLLAGIGITLSNSQFFLATSVAIQNPNQSFIKETLQDKNTFIEETLNRTSPQFVDTLSLNSFSRPYDAEALIVKGSEDIINEDINLITCSNVSEAKENSHYKPELLNKEDLEDNPLSMPIKG